MLPDLIVGSAVLLITFIIIRSMYRDRKKSKAAGCSGCSGCCSTCHLPQNDSPSQKD